MPFFAGRLRAFIGVVDGRTFSQPTSAAAKSRLSDQLFHLPR